jgi:HK97 family phage prohead protease
MTVNRSGTVYWNDIDPGAADGWLLELVPEEIPLMLDHGPGELGRLVAAERDETGLRVLLAVSEGRIGDQALAAIDQGELRHLSCAYGIEAARDATPPGADAAVWRVSEIKVAEVSLTDSPADPRCRIVSVGGRAPMWMQVEQARERHHQLRAALARRVPSVAHA